MGVVVENLWNRIAVDSAEVPLTEPQRTELQKRLDEDDAHPGAVTPWEQVKASTLSRLGK